MPAPASTIKIPELFPYSSRPAGEICALANTRRLLLGENGGTLSPGVRRELLHCMRIGRIRHSTHGPVCREESGVPSPAWVGDPSRTSSCSAPPSRTIQMANVDLAIRDFFDPTRAFLFLAYHAAASPRRNGLSGCFWPLQSESIPVNDGNLEVLRL